MRGKVVKKLDQVALVLVIFAGINWGLWGLFEFNLVYYIFGRDLIDRVVYFILGVAAIYLAVSWKTIGFRWSHSKK